MCMGGVRGGSSMRIYVLLAASQQRDVEDRWIEHARCAEGRDSHRHDHSCAGTKPARENHRGEQSRCKDRSRIPHTSMATSSPLRRPSAAIHCARLFLHSAISCVCLNCNHDNPRRYIHYGAPRSLVPSPPYRDSSKGGESGVHANVKSGLARPTHRSFAEPRATRPRPDLSSLNIVNRQHRHPPTPPSPTLPEPARSHYPRCSYSYSHRARPPAPPQGKTNPSQRSNNLEKPASQRPREPP